MTRLWTLLSPKGRAEAAAADEGSIVMAMLGLVIMSSVATIGLASVVSGQKQTRHDNAFAQALTGAESGLDAMVAQIKASPTATSFTSPRRWSATPPRKVASASFARATIGSTCSGLSLIPGINGAIRIPDWMPRRRNPVAECLRTRDEYSRER